MDLQSNESENLAQTLARELPKPVELEVLGKMNSKLLGHIAMPKGFDLKEIDLERLLDTPRRTKAAAMLTDCESFLKYVEKYSQPRSVVWCEFNPQSFKLSFCLVVDEHQNGTAGWRDQQARYTPAMSAEWQTWVGGNKQQKGQIEFAEFIEKHEPDIATQDGYPTSLQMMTMATEFEANSEKRFKSVVRIQGGGVRMDFVDDDDSATQTQMKLFEKFQIGIPVFWAGPGYRIDARLKYRHAQGKVNFWYDLIRQDRVHEAAAKELIDRVRAGIGSLPLLMGESK